MYVPVGHFQIVILDVGEICCQPREILVDQAVESFEKSSDSIAKTQTLFALGSRAQDQGQERKARQVGDNSKGVTPLVRRHAF